MGPNATKKLDAIEDPMIRAYDEAPLASPNDVSPEDLAELEAAMAEPCGEGTSTADVFAMIATRARSEG